MGCIFKDTDMAKLGIEYISTLMFCGEIDKFNSHSAEFITCNVLVRQYYPLFQATASDAAVFYEMQIPV